MSRRTCGCLCGCICSCCLRLLLLLHLLLLPLLLLKLLLLFSNNPQISPAYPQLDRPHTNLRSGHSMSDYSFRSKQSSSPESILSIASPAQSRLASSRIARTRQADCSYMLRKIPGESFVCVRISVSTEVAICFIQASTICGV